MKYQTEAERAEIVESVKAAKRRAGVHHVEEYPNEWVMNWAGL